MTLRPSIFWRLFAGLIAVSLGGMGITAVFLYLRFAQLNERFRDETLHSFVLHLVHDIAKRTGSIPDRIAATAAHITSNSGRYVIAASDGAVLAASPGEREPLFMPESMAERHFTLSNGAGQPASFGLSERVSFVTPPIYVQVAFPANEIVFDSVIEEFVRDIGWIWPLLMVAVLVVNLLVARLALKPLSRAAREVEQIGPNSVALRLSEDDLPRDVQALVRGVNLALDRLQSGYRNMEDFVADVAHELRTPLAILKAHLSAASRSDNATLLDEVSSLDRLIDQLLDRARLGRLHYEQRDLLDLAEIARDAARLLAPMAVTQGRLLELEGAEQKVPVRGARDFLFRAVRNLIENALAHAPVGSVVTITVDEEPSITIRDRGAGLPDHLIDGSWSSQQLLPSDRLGGVGLGLLIVEKTMAAHGGRLDLRNHAEGGALARLVLPVCHLESWKPSRA